MKSISHKSNSSTSRIVRMGGSSRLEMPPILWHLSQVDTNWCASLNKIEVPLLLSFGLQTVPHMIRCGSDLEYSPFHLLVPIALSLDPHNVCIK